MTVQQVQKELLQQHIKVSINGAQHSCLYGILPKILLWCYTSQNFSINLQFVMNPSSHKHKTQHSNCSLYEWKIFGIFPTNFLKQILLIYQGYFYILAHSKVSVLEHHSICVVVSYSVLQCVSKYISIQRPHLLQNPAKNTSLKCG